MKPSPPLPAIVTAAADRASHLSRNDSRLAAGRANRVVTLKQGSGA